MTISSRTPEGLPSHCPLCGAETKLEFSEPAGDAPCPSCGCLLWKSEQVLSSVQQIVAESQSVPVDEIEAETLLRDLQTDSIDLVELVMALGDEFDLEIPDENYSQIQSIGDLVRYIINQQMGDPR